MQQVQPSHMRSLLLACCLAAAYPTAQAVETSSTTTTTTAAPSTTTTAIGTSATTESKLSAEFAEFLGGEEQASTVISGLRQGTAFSLDPASETTDTTASTGTTTTTTVATTIDPPTGTMGYGNVRITLRLAQAQLNQLGITQPTTEELSAILLGGDINGAQVNGILTLRAEGMGWGQIAKEYGMTVGQLMGKGTGLTKPSTTTTASQTKTAGKTGSNSSASSQSTQTSKAHANGYIASSSKSASASQARSNGYIPSGKSNGSGIVSATGSSLGTSSSGLGKGLAKGNTPPSAAGTPAGGQHVTMSGGGSNATAPGQIKKN